MSSLPSRSSPALDLSRVDRLGLVAGGGRFPVLLAQAAAAQSIPVSAFAIKSITDASLGQHVAAMHWLELGELSRLIEQCHSDGVRHVVMAGHVPHNSIWRYRGFDKRALRLLGRMVTRQADSILGAVVEELAREGIETIEQSALLDGCMPEKGLLTPRRPLTAREEKDIEFGFPIARQVAGLDIGQSIVVKDLSVVAVEGLEGTDQTIRRAGEIAGQGFVLVKVSKPHQDSRFDIPVIGPGTIRSMREAGGGAVAIMAEETLFFDRDEAVELAHQAGIAIQAI